MLDVSRRGQEGRLTTVGGLEAEGLQNSSPGCRAGQGRGPCAGELSRM